jgi:hypothetical protein
MHRTTLISGNYNLILLVESILDLATECSDALEEGFNCSSGHHAQLSELEEKLANTSLLQLLDGPSSTGFTTGITHEGVVSGDCKSIWYP